MPARSSITFFYYDDLAAAGAFYETIMGFELLMSQEIARVYRIAPHSYFGIVDGAKGHLRARPESAALLTLLVDDVEAWHLRLAAAGAPHLTEIRSNSFCDHFFLKDPAGYAIEVQRFRDAKVTALFA